MAIVTSGTGQNNDAANEGPSFVFFLLDFLRSNTSWTIAGSGDGSASGGMTVDAIDTQAKLQTNTSWVVLEDPTSTVQILFSRNGSNDLSWNVYLNPDADYTGGNATTNPTNPGANAALVFNSNLVDAGNSRFHMTADDGAGIAGWAIYSHTQGAFTNSDGGVYFIPLENPPSGDAQNYVLYVQAAGAAATGANLSQETVATTGNRAHGTGSVTGVVTVVPAWTYESSGSTIVPLLVGADPDGDDLYFPMLWGRKASAGNGGYKGVSTFAQWNGIARGQCEQLNGLARISFGDANFTWDGASVPASS